MIASLLVAIYRLVHGRLHLPGAGMLIRLLVPIVPGLRNFPLVIPDVGTVMLDFQDEAAFGMMNCVLRDFGSDRELIRQIESLLKPESVFWDVGANVGYLSMHFARPEHGLKSLHAFEPNPAALKMLQSLFSSHPRAQVHPVGLGDTNQEMVMSVRKGESQLGSLTHQLENGEGIKIQIRRGDDYREQQSIPLPDVIKIDVEGFEPNVLSGLKETIAAKRPAIVLEHIWLTDEALQAMLPAGYSIQFILDSGGTTPDFAQRMRGHNAIFLPPCTAAQNGVDPRQA